MRVECECGKLLKVNDNLIGKRVRCPGCGTTLLVEAAPTAIAAGRPGPAPTIADDTPRPRKRPAVADDEPAPPPRKRRPADDFEDDDDDDRPRRKKKKQKSSGMPMLLILGGLAAVVLLVLLIGGGVGAYFLFFRKGPEAAGAPTKGPGSKNEPVAIKFHVPSKVGQAYDFSVVADTVTNVAALKGGPNSMKVVVEGTAKPLAVDASGRETRTELNLSKVTLNKGQGDTVAVAPKTIVMREVHATGFVTYSVKNGPPLGLEANLALQEVFGKGLKAGDVDDDQAFGTSDKKVVGDTWPVKKGPLVQSINQGAGGAMAIREESLSGTVKFSSVTEEGGVSFLNFDIAITIKQNGTQVNAGPGGQQSVNVAVTLDMSYRIPADYSTPAVRQTQKIDMKLEVMGQGLGAGNVSISANKTGTRKFQSSGGKGRAGLVLPPGAGLPRMDVALADCPVWEARREVRGAMPTALRGHAV